MAYTIPVRVGQVWKHETHPCGYKIVRISEDKRLYATRMGSNSGEEVPFGRINDDGTPVRWDEGWTCEESETSFSSLKTYQSDLDFFKATSPGCCVCNIPREACTFHR